MKSLSSCASLPSCAYLPLLSKFIQVILLFMPNLLLLLFSDFLHKSSLPILIFICKKSLLARHAFALFERTTSNNWISWNLMVSKVARRQNARASRVCVVKRYAHTLLPLYNRGVLRWCTLTGGSLWWSFFLHICC